MPSQSSVLVKIIDCKETLLLVKKSLINRCKNVSYSMLFCYLKLLIKSTDDNNLISYVQILYLRRNVKI